MRGVSLSDQRQKSLSQPADETRVTTGWKLRIAQRRSTRAASLAAVAVILAVVASGCARPSASVAGSDLASGVASVAVAEGPEVIETAPHFAGVEEQTDPSVSLPSAGPEPSVAVDSVAGAEWASDEAAALAPEDELVAELRASLSDRSGRRAVEAAPELAFEQIADVVTLEEKLANARVRTLDTPAVSSDSAIKTPTPKPAPPKAVVRKATPTPKPVVKKAATPKPVTTVAPTISGLGQRVVSIAMSYLGYRYVYGGASPSGFDCRGFTYWVYLKAGHPIPITLAGQYATGLWVARSAF